MCAIGDEALDQADKEDLAKNNKIAKIIGVVFAVFTAGCFLADKYTNIFL